MTDHLLSAFSSEFQTTKSKPITRICCGPSPRRACADAIGIQAPTLSSSSFQTGSRSTVRESNVEKRIDRGRRIVEGTRWGDVKADTKGFRKGDYRCHQKNAHHLDGDHSFIRLRFFTSVCDWLPRRIFVVGTTKI
ncbi:hypothetical protein MHU86_18108 [Fragilaria crotonensis]|nr:hypothetical protein MHU86_18108 [Fragilaria crotonensis]